MAVDFSATHLAGNIAAGLNRRSKLYCLVAGASRGILSIYVAAGRAYYHLNSSNLEMIAQTSVATGVRFRLLRQSDTYDPIEP